LLVPAAEIVAQNKKKSVTAALPLLIDAVMASYGN